MSKEPTRSDLPAGDSIADNSARAVFARRRPTAPRTPTRPDDAMPVLSSAAGGDASGPAGGARRLRRWSVAELIARAVAPPPTA